MHRSKVRVKEGSQIGAIRFVFLYVGVWMSQITEKEKALNATTYYTTKAENAGKVGRVGLARGLGPI